MEGPLKDRGVNYRTLQKLFETVEARKQETDFTIAVSLLEVHPTAALPVQHAYDVSQAAMLM